MIFLTVHGMAYVKSVADFFPIAVHNITLFFPLSLLCLLHFIFVEFSTLIMSHKLFSLRVCPEQFCHLEFTAENKVFSS